MKPPKRVQMKVGEFYTLQGAAEALGLSYWTVYRYVRIAGIPTKPLSNLTLVKLEDLRELGTPPAADVAAAQHTPPAADVAGAERMPPAADVARAGFERALALARQLGDPAAEATELRNLGSFIGRRGEPERGRALIKESLAISERLSDVYNIGKCHQMLAWIDRDEGRRDEAMQHYREALRRFEQVQSPDAEKVRADLRGLGAQP